MVVHVVTCAIAKSSLSHCPSPSDRGRVYPHTLYRTLRSLSFCCRYEALCNTHTALSLGEMADEEWYQCTHTAKKGGHRLLEKVVVAVGGEHSLPNLAADVGVDELLCKVEAEDFEGLHRGSDRNVS